MERASRARELVGRLREHVARLIPVIEAVPEEAWNRSTAPGVWSIGKEAEHVADAAAYHQWIVRLSIGERVSSRRPSIERARMTTALLREQVVDLIRTRTEEGATLLGALTDEQLDLPTKPPRARNEPLADTIERVLIGHYEAHRLGIQDKLANG
ncbi:MAG TPA: DinB family protein [Candidatus Limnocylindria bacterium]|jgi:uncharacterized damage-inducible protein DinB